MISSSVGVGLDMRVRMLMTDLVGRTTPAALVGLVVLSAVLSAGCQRRAPWRRVTVFAAASLDQVLADLSLSLRETENLEVRVETTGSQEAARKVAEYGREADVLLVADHRVIDWILGPEVAPWTIQYATNELVLAYSENSRYAAEITTDNWPEVILRPDVKVARADENLGPVGYQTFLCCKLATVKYAALLDGRDLYAELMARTTEDLIRPDVTGLIPLVGTRADYAFIYRSVAHGHNLPYVRLAPEVNLADPDQADFYAKAEVHLRDPDRVIRGSPIVYGCTIPADAPDAAAAARFLQALLGDQGRETMERNGFTVLPQPICDQPARLPEALRPMVAEGESDFR